MDTQELRRHAALLDANGRDGSTLEQCADEIDRLRAALQSIADDVCDNTYTRAARLALTPNNLDQR